MTGIARYVTDPEIKKILRETDGLGTEATRAGIIELLFKRQFLTKQGKEIRATDIGKKLINSLPERMVVPDMTAHWEAQLEAICKKRMRYNDFMLPLVEGLNGLLGEVEAKKQHFAGLNGLGKNTFQKRTGGRKKSGVRVNLGSESEGSPRNRVS
jgi:DNA topoisomerase-3